jgi:Spy/CpxP family protein refolding chaperone
MKRSAVLLSTMAAALLLAAPTFAQPGLGLGAGAGPGFDGPATGHGRSMRRGNARMGGRRGHMAMRRLMALNLSEAQIKKIHDIKGESQKKVIKKRADARIAQIDIRKEMMAKAPNKVKIHMLVKKIGAIRTDIRILNVDEKLAVRSVLTKEQLKKFLDLNWRPAATTDVKAGMRGSRAGRRANW